MLTGLHRLALLRGGIDAALELLDMAPGSGGNGGLLLEDGGHLLLEDSTYLLME